MIRFVPRAAVYFTPIMPSAGFIPQIRFGLRYTPIPKDAWRTIRTDSIRTGPLNQYRDRTCDHFKIDGDIDFKDRISVKGPYSSTNAGITYQGTTFRYRTNFPWSSYSAQIIIDAAGADHAEYHLTLEGDDYTVWTGTHYYGWTGPAQIDIFVDDIHEVSSSEWQCNLRTVLSRQRWEDVGPARKEFVDVVTSKSVWRSMSFMAEPCEDIPISRQYKQLLREDILNSLPFVPAWDKGELCWQAVQNLRVLTLNSTMYIKEMLAMGEQVKATVDLFKGRPDAKKLASGYLSYHYGWRLTFKDTKDLCEKVQTEKLTFLRRNYAPQAQMSSDVTLCGFFKSPAKCRGNLKLRCRDSLNGIDRVLKTLINWDFLPTPDNIWDFVPYSFVVDWFFPIGDVLERLSGMLDFATVNVDDCLYSRKLESTLSPEDAERVLTLRLGLDPNVASIASDFVVGYYRRWNECYATPPSLIGQDQAQDFTHWVEAAALIVQRL